ncbi:amino acid ABC transporter substrate-binding protein, PAAT family (TC 3.A.1.3.-) [Thermosyntropha lipolytica DSM 11003]|uniref:Amino acid ABC transporter substrate-binding protein, PAAT family (TC 3.A.1.3.-) n=1 Tax=Thermosyntropha lipolytica DSM 11003 TaxID=1123382 RepID=A0A1M5R0K0_9FIRM|nr:amino acid ABC transporter substrate-binding protein [Thermosyntropha lipolytica]SHH19688.1 amino acid ABC transporter substrate-binding protein, PAAT family (TC 3.A.1.3.-) [Thermosyntropha lipolytica DSM 11003]
MRRKIVFILVLSLVLGIMLAGCGTNNSGSKAPAEDSSWEDIKEKGYFIVGLDDAFPPMGFRDENNQIVGFDIDLAKEAAKRLGLEVKFQPIVWETKEQELNGGNIDVIWNGLTITEERKKHILFTKPYMEDHQIIVVRADSDIETKEDLIGKKIGIQAGSSAIEAVEADPIYEKIKDNILEFESNVLALRDLKGGGIDAVVVDEVVGRYYISKQAEDYKILKDNFGVEQFGVGLRKGDKAFLAQLEKVLDEMKEDGTAAEISKKWFGVDIIKY